MLTKNETIDIIIFKNIRRIINKKIKHNQNDENFNTFSIFDIFAFNKNKNYLIIKIKIKIVFDFVDTNN